jgi:hypothetical protein
MSTPGIRLIPKSWFCSDFSCFGLSTLETKFSEKWVARISAKPIADFSAPPNIIGNVDAEHLYLVLIHSNRSPD